MSDEQGGHSEFTRLVLNGWNYSHTMMLYGLYQQENWSQQPRRVPMRKILLSLTAVSALVAAASIAPANAMTVGTAPGVQAAIDGTSLVEDVAYVCSHRYYSSRRACWWRPGGYYRPYRRYYRRW